jgi:glycosyltransferase A (GT-A) superfamily protein (DUF2064 family)
MQQNHSNTAVLIFVRTELEEVRSKKGYSGAGFQNDLELTRFLNRQVIAVAKASRLPTFIISGKDQIGENFGERFSNALQSVFKAGYQHVIALGNDCLTLTTEHLRQAYQKLQSCPLVIGPASDGGAYLIGLNKEIFHSNLFQDLPWQNDTLLSGLKNMALQLNASYEELSEEKDLDSVNNLREIIRESGFRLFPLSLLSIIGYSIGQNIDFFSSFVAHHFSICLPQRAPPELV